MTAHNGILESLGVLIWCAAINNVIPGRQGHHNIGGSIDIQRLSQLFSHIHRETDANITTYRMPVTCTYLSIPRFEFIIQQWIWNWIKHKIVRNVKQRQFMLVLKITIGNVLAKSDAVVSVWGLHISKHPSSFFYKLQKKNQLMRTHAQLYSR